MARTNHIAATILEIGESASATLTPAFETITLEMTCVNIVAGSQARLLVKDTEGVVKGSASLASSAAIRLLVDKIEGQSLTAEIECLKGEVRVSLDEMTGVEAVSGVATLDSNDLGTGSVTTAKLAAGAATPAKMSYAGLKCLAAAGNNGAGSIALVGAAVGDRLVVAFGSATAGGVLLPIVNDASVFEATITVVDEIQQASIANLSGNTYVFLLAPAAA